MGQRSPKAGSLDDLLFQAYMRGASYNGTDAHGMLEDFRSWRESASDPDALPMADEPMPFPWDER